MSADLDQQRERQRLANRRSYWRNRERIRARRGERSAVLRQTMPPTAPKTDEERRAAARERARRWKERNRDKVLARRQEYDRRRYAIHRAEILARRRTRYRTQPEVINARNRAWYQANRERRRIAQRIWYQENLESERAKARLRGHADYERDAEAIREYNRQWRRRNPEKAHLYVRLSSHRRRAAGLQSFTAGDWLAVLSAHAGRCAYCDASGKLAMEHRIPISRGGDNSIENILPACKRCNSRKHTKTENEFRLLLAREAIVTALAAR